MRTSWTTLCCLILVVSASCSRSEGRDEAPPMETAEQPLVSPPAGLKYSQAPAVYTLGEAITKNTPSSTGGAVASYAVAPALPTGLKLNATTGDITGMPTALSPKATYTVTAKNAGGSTTVKLDITVNAVPPSALAYALNPAVYTKGVAITDNPPLSSGGAVVSYGVTPALPAGLQLDTTSGVISGKPTALSAAAGYTVTATNTGGSTTVTVIISVVAVAPIGLTYATNPVTYTKGVATQPDVPSNAGGAVVSYTISPVLPAGLTLSATTGEISGTPTALAAANAYTVTATNSGGSTTVSLTLSVVDVPPSDLAYAVNPAVYTRAQTITDDTPTTSGGPVVTWEITPALPAGLSLSPTSGVISGKPTVLSTETAYTVTATNTGGSTTARLKISVVALPPSSLTYSLNPAIYTKGVAIAANTPTISGGPVVTWGISSALPAGLTLGTNGVVSGTPTALSAKTAYTVTATNTGGSTTATLTITVNDVAPSALTYSTNPATYTRGTGITDDTPAISGGPVVTWGILPALPAGLTLETNGVVSGTPTALSAKTGYTVTATNTGGSTTATLTITVNDVAPSTLTYSTNPAVYTKGTAITANTPTISGGPVVTWKISPALPAGLTLETNGVVSGTPTALSAKTGYTVTATNTGGSTTATLTITVNDVAPSTLTYSTNPAVYTKGTAITANTPTISGGPVVTWGILPALPAGLTLETNGVVSGTPTALSAKTGYTVTATNTGGSTTATLKITVNDVAPSALTYSTNPATYTKGTAITDDTPTISGGPVVTWKISPALPAGLTFETTGIVSGTPTALSAETPYTVTATNTGGSTTVTLTITVVAVAPSDLAYATNPATYTQGQAITDNNLSGSGGAASYGIEPALPAGLSFSLTTGVISGTPNAESAQNIYTVRATNTGGTATVALVITVLNACGNLGSGCSCTASTCATPASCTDNCGATNTGLCAGVQCDGNTPGLDTCGQAAFGCQSCSAASCTSPASCVDNCGATDATLCAGLQCDSSNPGFDTCGQTDAQCGASRDAGVGGGTETCTQVLSCFLACSTSACMAACISGGTTTAQGEFDALSSCVSSACGATVDGGPCSSQGATCNECESSAISGACSAPYSVCTGAGAADSGVAGPPDSGVAGPPDSGVAADAGICTPSGCADPAACTDNCGASDPALCAGQLCDSSNPGFDTCGQPDPGCTACSPTSCASAATCTDNCGNTDVALCAGIQCGLSHPLPDGGPSEGLDTCGQPEPSCLSCVAASCTSPGQCEDNCGAQDPTLCAGLVCGPSNNGLDTCGVADSNCAKCIATTCSNPTACTDNCNTPDPALCAGLQCNASEPGFDTCGQPNPKCTTSSDAGTGGTTETCPQILSCALACGTSECTDACISSGTTTAQSEFAALGACVDSACGASVDGGACSSPGAACNACESSAITGSCSGPYNACVGSGSADAGVTVDAGPCTPSGCANPVKCTDNCGASDPTLCGGLQCSAAPGVDTCGLADPGCIACTATTCANPTGCTDNCGQPDLALCHGLACAGNQTGPGTDSCGLPDPSCGSSCTPTTCMNVAACTDNCGNAAPALCAGLQCGATSGFDTCGNPDPACNSCTATSCEDPSFCTDNCGDTNVAVCAGLQCNATVSGADSCGQVDSNCTSCSATSCTSPLTCTDNCGLSDPTICAGLQCSQVDGQDTCGVADAKCAFACTVASCEDATYCIDNCDARDTTQCGGLQCDPLSPGTDSCGEQTPSCASCTVTSCTSPYTCRDNCGQVDTTLCAGIECSGQGGLDTCGNSDTSCP